MLCVGPGPCPDDGGGSRPGTRGGHGARADAHSGREGARTHHHDHRHPRRGSHRVNDRSGAAPFVPCALCPVSQQHRPTRRSLASQHRACADNVCEAQLVDSWL